MLQLWEGFGGGLSEKGWEALNVLGGRDKVRILHALFNPEEGCRLQFARIPVGASAMAKSDYSHNSTPNDLGMRFFDTARDSEALIPFLRIPLNRIRKFKTVACPWSPPQWMKETGGGGGDRIKWESMVLEAYALYLARFVQSYRREGIVIDHLLIQNEPAANTGVPGCHWTAAQLRDFIRNYCGPVMMKEKLSVRLWLGALDSPDYNDYPLTALSDPLAMPFIAGVACQHRGRGTLARIRRAFPDMLLMQSDCGAGDGRNTWMQGHDTFAVVQQAIAAGVNICVYDNMVSAAGATTLSGRSLNALIMVDPQKRTGVFTPDYHVLRHFSALVNRYAVRLGLTGEWADRAVVFYNEDDESRVMVVHNPAATAERLVLADGDRRLVLMLPPQSFNTVVL